MENTAITDDFLKRGVETIIEKPSLIRQLKSGAKLRVKHGIDPTGENIHLGRAVVLRKLKQFQELGHKIVLIIGDFTAEIGDPSDKLEKRPFLTEEQVKKNLKSYLPQIGTIIDLKKAEVRYNSEWLKKLNFREISRLAEIFTVAQMIERKNFKERWERREEISLREFLYPLMQGYDSVAVRADVELGGSDQLFNLLAGRKIQEYYGQAKQNIMTTKMLLGLDGRKMSTSWGNVINITENPSEMYGKIMSMKDELIPDYLELCTDTPPEEIDTMQKRILRGVLNPRDAKAKLAGEIVAIYQGKTEALKAAAGFKRVFQEHKLPTSMRRVVIKTREVPILDLLVKTKLVSSKSEAKRLILQKGVEIDGENETDWRKVIETKEGMVIQVGRRRFVKITK